jgi:DNA-binding transcriptional LysR family regulator
MPPTFPSLSTDQLQAFVELARQGHIRAAARVLGITEQGVRNRLIALESRLGVELYRKSRGPRRSTQLTQKGRRFLPQALAFLERACELCQSLEAVGGEQEVHVVSSQYLILYVLIDVLKRFRRECPSIHVRLSTLNELEIEEAVLQDPEVAFGVAAPYEASPELVYHELFAMDWSLIAPPEHPLARRRGLRIEHLAEEPIILFEKGSTGRQHILDAFHDLGLSPRVAMETTHTEIIVRMVEAGLGISIVPLLTSGAVTRGRKVAVRSLAGQIRPIHSGLLVRRRETLDGASGRFFEFVKRHGQP